MKRAGWVVLAVLVSALATGCGGRYEQAQARIQLKVFEVPTHLLREYTLGTDEQKMRDSSYSLCVMSPEELNSLLSREDSKPRFLHEHTRVINSWPRTTDSWSYSEFRAAGGHEVCTGGGAGYLGVRERKQQLDIRIDYIINHRGPGGRKEVESNVRYENAYPRGQILVFHSPMRMAGSRPRQHVVTVQAVREKWAPTYKRFTDGRRQMNSAQSR